MSTNGPTVPDKGPTRFRCLLCDSVITSRDEHAHCCTYAVTHSYHSGDQEMTVHSTVSDLEALRRERHNTPQDHRKFSSWKDAKRRPKARKKR